MTKKKRNHPDIDEILARPWCYYCERDFDDLKILINHQKAKHFKCERCGRRLNTAGGLSVHMSQVHKENLTAVDNALPNRAGLDIEIFGMEGIPEDIVQQHTQRVLTNFHQAQAERQAATGNPVPGGANANAAKKPKLEAVSDLKKRLAEHKAAKLAAEQATGGSSGGGTPTGAGQSQGHTPTNAVSSPNYPQYQQPYTAPGTNGSFNQSQPYPQPAATTPYPQQPQYGQPPSALSTFGQPPIAQNYPQQPYAQPPQPSFQQHPPVAYPPQPSFSPPPFPNQSQYPGQQYPQALAAPYSGQPGGAPRPYAVGSPVPPFPQQHIQQNHSPPNGFPQPIRTGSVSLPNATGLPQRPAFGAPQVNAFQFQQMHQGQIPVSQNHASQPQFQNKDVAPGIASAQNGTTSYDAPNAASIDDLISSVSKQADANITHADSAPAVADPPPATVSTTTAAKDEASEDKGAKKDKEKPKATRLVYSDNEISPEEKMAMLPRYAFTPAQKSIMV